MRFEQTWYAGVREGNGCKEYFPATVPGNVQRDYAAHIGILNDIMFSDNVTRLEETEGYTWEYCTTLDFDAELNQKVYFVAEGIDYIFDIMLDGKKLYSQEGMYTKVELDITQLAHKGSELKVIIHPHPILEGSIKRDRSEAAGSCKPPACYLWDWNPRLLISGMWLPAYIEVRNNDFIRNFEINYNLDVKALRTDINFEIDCDVNPIITLIDPDGNIVYKGNDTEISLDDVRLWWCNGQGKPELYTWIAETKGDRKTGKIGFRTIRLVRNGGTDIDSTHFPKGPYAAPITIELNGRKIFAKGSNYVGCDIFNANTPPERNQMLVSSAKEANMNIIRVWGGSGLAKPEFYDYCDENGIMVWQEFMLACNNYIGTPHYLEVLEQEAKSIILSLRHHSCLAFWCGGNELFNAWSGMDDQSLALRLLNKLCYEYDRNRPFIMTSPIRGMSHGGYVFRDLEEREVYQIFAESRNTAYTEFGQPSIAPVEQLKKIIPEDELFPMRPTDSWICHHGFKAWEEHSWCHLDIIEHYFGEQDSLEKYVALSQWLQNEGYKAAFEEARRQWPSCSMAINWCFNEPWITAANNSLISYPDVKKPAFFAVKNALRSTIPTARIPKFKWKDHEKIGFELWYLNDSTETVSDNVKVSIIIGNETVELLTWETGNVGASVSKQGPTAYYTLPSVENVDRLTIKLTSTNGLCDNEYQLAYYYVKPEKKVQLMNH